jgi:hypothetical protein
MKRARNAAVISDGIFNLLEAGGSAMTPDWRFLNNEGQEEEGLGHAGIETFKGSPYPGLARECAQNSLDACEKTPDGNHLPVRMLFRHRSVPRESIPSVESLEQALAACLARSKERKIAKDKSFFERACDAIRKDKISVLTVEDYGTTGLVGPSEPGTPFHALVKATGVSQKSSSDAGGSFGIGKNAAFAVAGLRTVFYATVYHEGRQPSFLAQGKAILVSHADASNLEKRATGYWGNPPFNAVTDRSLVPDWLRRTAVGTTVASVGFDPQSGWEWEMVESLIRSFFCAVRTGAISFSVLREGAPEIQVNEESLEELFVHPEVVRAAAATGSTEDLAFSAAMAEAITSPNSLVFEEDFPGIGRFRFRLLERPDLPRKVGFLRNGMYLTDNLRAFGHPLVRFDLSRDFVGVVEPADAQTSSRLRELENPRHDELSPERLDDPARRRQVRAGVRKLGQWLRDTIKAQTATAPSEVIQLDEMNRFFASPEKADRIADRENGETSPERIRLKPKAQRGRPPGAGPDGESGSAGGQKEGGNGKGRTSGARPGQGRGMQGGRGGRWIGFHSLRTHLPDSRDSRIRSIGLQPEESGIARLEVLAVGAASDEPLDIVCLNGDRCAKAPSVMLEEGVRKTLTVQLAEPYAGPVRVVLTPVEESRDAD